MLAVIGTSGKATTVKASFGVLNAKFIAAKIFDASGSGDDIVLSSVEALVNAINLIHRA